MSKFIHLFSGGLDSTVLLYDLLDQENTVKCLLFDYGQRHIKELEYASKTCEKLGVEYERIHLPYEMFSRSTLTKGLVPGVDELAGGATVVPNRNMVLISMAASYALCYGGTAVTWAANADDAEHYPDCRSEFLQHLNRALRICHTRRMEVHAPYIVRTKKQVVDIGRRLNIPFAETWSCYAGTADPCGKCGACNVRKAAMA
jgi:7-cyano-7-deazaguanine synthase